MIMTNSPILIHPLLVKKIICKEKQQSRWYRPTLLPIARPNPHGTAATSTSPT